VAKTIKADVKKTKPFAKVIYTWNNGRVSWSAGVFKGGKVECRSWIPIPIAQVNSTFSYETLSEAKKSAKSAFSEMGISVRPASWQWDTRAVQQAEARMAARAAKRDPITGTFKKTQRS
jgi:hypothetical protein